MAVLWWSRIKNYLYDKDLLRSFSSGSFVISVGNITWGGTGKTALTAQVASFLMKERYRVAIVSRGYGRKSRGLLLVSDGKHRISEWQEAGEEAYWLSRRLPEAIVVVSENRRRALRFLVEYQPDVVMLDDAFQHRKVARDLDIVVVDANENLYKQKVIPFGKLREPIESLKRGDMIILTHATHADAFTLNWISENLSVPVFLANYRPLEPERLMDKKLGVFCAIGAPRHFLSMLQEQGAQVLWSKKFRDHHSYTGDQLRRIESEARLAGATMLATTEKDAVKVQDFPFRLPLLIVKAELKLENETEFFRLLGERLSFFKYA